MGPFKIRARMWRPGGLGKIRATRGVLMIFLDPHWYEASLRPRPIGHQKEPVLDDAPELAKESVDLALDDASYASLAEADL